MPVIERKQTQAVLTPFLFFKNSDARLYWEYRGTGVCTEALGQGKEIPCLLGGGTSSKELVESNPSSFFKA
jgi:hypothetical protein